MRTWVRYCMAGAAAATLLACTAQPVRDAASLPSTLPTSPAPAAQALPAPAPAVRVPPPRSAAQAARPARIDEFYAASSRSARGGPVDVRSRREEQAGDVTLDFRDTDLNKVVQAIIGDILRRNYIIDPNVTGKVTLTTDRPLRQDELIPTLEAVLASMGARLVRTGDDIYRVTRATGPGALAGSTIDFSNASGEPASMRIFPLGYISASEMTKILQPLLPQGAILHSDEGRNLLIIGGSGQDLRLAKSTVDIFDVNQMSDQNVLMISVQHADAAAIVAELRSIFHQSGDTGGPSNILRFVTVDRLNSILIMSSQREYIERAREWVYRLDRQYNPNDRRLYVYYVQNGRADRLVDSLREVMGNLNGTPVTYRASRSSASAGSGNTFDTPPAPSASPVPSVQTSAATGTITPTPAVLDGGATANNARQGPLISVDIDRNALLVSATPGEFALVEEVLAKLDIQALQVMIDLTIFEVTLNDQLRYGIQYAASNGGLAIGDDGAFNLTRGTLTGASGSIIQPIIAPAVPGFSFTIEGESRTRFILDALSAVTEVNVLSSPNILVVNNKVAKLLVGDEVPIITQTTTSTVTTNPLIVNTVQYRNTGVSLEVTPHVNASGIITLDIAQNVSDVSQTTTSNIDSPTIQNRSLLTTVSVRSGETVMLGGLIRAGSLTDRSGIPLLHDLPGIGFLFGSKNNTASRTELVIMMRPIISTTPSDIQQVTQDMQRKFHQVLQSMSVGVPQPRRGTREGE
jgi:general secretion pathway protein D